jgi:hypothetical protein
MATNKYFNHRTFTAEQNLIDDLVVESIKMFGYDVKYLPRSFVAKDNLLGEDPISQFIYSIPVEVYVENAEGWEGEQDFISKLGLEIHDQITFRMAKRRWEQVRTEKLLSEWGYNIEIEGSDDTIQLEDLTTTGEGYTITATRPMEGDLIYYTPANAIFEIMFVEHEDVFYQAGALSSYKIICEIFRYSSDRLDTGEADVDAIETSYSTDMLFFQLQLETGDNALLEDGGSIITEAYSLESFDLQANNIVFTSQTGGSLGTIIDFSEENPFGDQEY